MNSPVTVDVLCIGHASYDLIFSVAAHPGEDEKIFASAFLGCGGGPAANAAVTASKLGFTAAFAGYLGRDLYGDKHCQELRDHGVDTHFVVRGADPTPLSVILVKPDGKRALINYKGGTAALPSDSVDFSPLRPKVVLFDGHEPKISQELTQRWRGEGIPSILDAGSLHAGTTALLSCVDYAACSEKFALQYAGDIETALQRLAAIAPVVIITLGDKGLVWRRGLEFGTLSAFPVPAVDTTGAGDAFHGALAAAVAAGLPWQDTLRYASAAGALCCTKLGARTGLPSRAEHAAFLKDHRLH